ncbi:hypothetical protein SDC9_142490 [bioreactor metagenome]|uniref:Uncharacterized protein n=1 Tax=bioreactor metagenome TaxID=1076179 RepID=A0A645E1A2_9ZZZZ
MGERIDSAFTGGVGLGIRFGLKGTRRTHVHHASARFNQVGRRELGAEERSCQVGADGTVPLLQRQFTHGLEDLVNRVVYQSVDPVKLFQGCPYRRPHAHLTGYVGNKKSGSFFIELRFYLLHRFIIHIENGDSVPHFKQ